MSSSLKVWIELGVARCQRSSRARDLGMVSGFFCLVLVVSLEALAALPNIVLIVVNDAGYLDFGSYGGEAKTSPPYDAYVP